MGDYKCIEYSHLYTYPIHKQLHGYNDMFSSAESHADAHYNRTYRIIK